ncbi:MAG TPA: helix-turn-helix transcriptional regulator [Ktedonobacteraceae bacterium]|nr:helix-turn-helix transcriptional regulator [Ktedonobacteraceae bacterium]
MKKMARTRLIEARKQRRWSQQNVADLIGTTRHNVSRWEAGLTAPGPYFRAKLCDLFGKSLLELGLVEEFPLPQTPFEKGTQGDGQAQSSIPDISPLWMVPYSRNPHFIGREDLLARLDQQFSPGKSHDPTATRRAALTQPQAIKGLGGIGKTQIAVEYAYRSREKNLYLTRSGLMPPAKKR